jgi:hypothetical protein
MLVHRRLAGPHLLGDVPDMLSRVIFATRSACTCFVCRETPDRRLVVNFHSGLEGAALSPITPRHVVKCTLMPDLLVDDARSD